MKIKSFFKNINNEEKSSFLTKNNKIISNIGSGYSNFNEITIKLLAQSLVNILNKNNKEATIKILIGNDGSNKMLPFFEKCFLDVISFQLGNIFAYEKNKPVSEAFLKFTNNITNAFLINIYINKYNEKDQYAISFFNKNNQPISKQFLDELLNEYQRISIENIKEMNDEYNYLDFDKLLKEYSSFLLEKNFTKNPNHLLKIGIINSKLQNSFVKRILGKNDISYVVLKNKNIEDKPNYLMFLKVSYPKLKNIEYIIKFSYNFKKIYLYKRDYNKKLSFTYSLVDITDLICNYIAFSNKTYININKNFIPIKNIYTTPLVKQDNIKNTALKFNLNLHINWVYDLSQINDLNSIYFDEDYNVFIANKINNGYDAFSFLSILVDMLNYYKTQEMKFNDISEQNLGFNNKILISEFKFDCDTLNLSDFETKLFVQDKIAQLKIESIENISNYIIENKSKYIAKINFSNNEWLGIKFDYENEKLIFIVAESKKTNGLLAKKLKIFMSKFTKKYNKPLIDL